MTYVTRLLELFGKRPHAVAAKTADEGASTREDAPVHEFHEGPSGDDVQPAEVPPTPMIARD